MGLWQHFANWFDGIRPARAVQPDRPFLAMAEADDDGVPLYLALLNLNGPPATRALQRLQTILRTTPAVSANVQPLLDDRNWRPHLIAGAAILMVDNPSRFAPALWAAIDAGSWVSPQLAVTLALTDPHFTADVQGRLAPGPTAPPSLSAKTASAVIHLLARTTEGARWVEEHRSDPRVDALLKADADRGDLLAARWESNLRKQCSVLGIALPSPAT